jgi:hypothetical protein
MTLLNIPNNLSWGTERQTLSVNSLAAVVAGLNGPHPVVLLRDAATGIGELDDIEKLLTDVGGDDDLASLGRLGCGAEDGIGSLLGPGDGLEVGVVVLVKDVDGELQ